MNSEQFKAVFNEGFASLSESFLKQLSEAYHQTFNLEYLLIESQEQIHEATKDAFPLVMIRVPSAQGDTTHTLGLSLSAVSRLLSWAANTSPKEDLEEEDMEVFSRQVQDILQAFPELNLGQPDFEFIESSDQFVTGEEDVYAVYELTAGEEKLKIFHAIRGIALEQGIGKEGVAVHPADFGKVPENPVGNGVTQNMDMLLDVELRVFVELGQKSMLINDILKLGKGSVIELEKAAGEPLDIFVNDKKFAMGEVVVVDDRFGIRITKLAGLNTKLGSLAG